HAVTIDIRVDDRGNASTLKAAGQIHDREIRRFGPAFDGYTATARIDTHRDFAGELLAGFLDQCRVTHGNGAKDNAGKALVEPGLDLLQRTDATAQLNRVLRGLQDCLDRCAIHAGASKSAIQI